MKNKYEEISVMKKKIVMLLTVAMICAGVTACGSTKESSNAEGGSVAIEDEEAPQAEDADSASETSGEAVYVEGTKEDFDFAEISDSELALTKYHGDAEYLIIPDNFSGREIVKVSGFSGKVNLKGVVIPDTVKTIGDRAFNGCENLETVTLGNGVETIDEAAFINCDSLSFVNLPDSITYIGEMAFDGNNIKELHIPTGLSEIMSGAFTNGKFSTVTIPGNIKVIGYQAMAANDELKTVYIEDGVEEIEYEVFDDCPQLEELHIPASVTTFGDDFIVDKTDILTIYAPEGSAAEEYAHSNDINFVAE